MADWARGSPDEPLYLVQGRQQLLGLLLVDRIALQVGVGHIVHASILSRSQDAPPGGQCSQRCTQSLGRVLTDSRLGDISITHSCSQAGEFPHGEGPAHQGRAQLHHGASVVAGHGQHQIGLAGDLLIEQPRPVGGDVLLVRPGLHGQFGSLLRKGIPHKRPGAGTGDPHSQVSQPTAQHHLGQRRAAHIAGADSEDLNHAAAPSGRFSSVESQNSGDGEAGRNTLTFDLFESERVKRVTPLTDLVGSPGSKRPKRGTRTWLEGSGTARSWNGTVVAYAAFAVGAAIVLSVVAENYLRAPLGPVLSSMVLWVGMAVPVVLALRRSVPRGLFRFRWTDILWGLSLGFLLRVVQGWLEVAAGSPGGLPAYSTLDGSIGGLPWLLTGVLGAVLIAPVVEELLFRGVILVTVFRTARRGLEGALLALIASATTFVAIHSVNGITRWDEPAYLFLVGLTCGLLVLLTGRIWGAVLVHIVFNGSWVVLALAGTALT